MLYYAAPMEGITTYIYRRAHARFYGGIDKYFTPFIAGKKMTTREVRDILPENNAGVALVPQILTNKADDFLEIADRLAAYGYDTVNLNLGCPSGTVTAKKRGAGFLGEPEALDAFLYEIYEKCPLQISIKTRLGISDLKEWERLLDIYARYPVQELIIHTRLLQEFYTGAPHPEAFAMALCRLRDTAGESARSVGTALCYNGDILSAESLSDIQASVSACIHGLSQSDEYNKNNRTCGAAHTALGTPVIDRIMIGRGLLQNPALAGQLQAGCFPDAASQTASPAPSGTGQTASASHPSSQNPETLRAFHDEILNGYCEIMSGDLPVLFKMKDLWTYMIKAFVSSAPAQSPEEPDRRTVEKHLKKIRKAARIPEYQIAVDGLFRECLVR